MAVKEGHEGHPLNVDAILALDNEPAKEAIPAEIATHLATQRLELSGDASLEQLSAAAQHLEGGLSVALPKGASLGLRGRLFERISMDDLKAAAGEPHAAGHRPAWAPLTYHPKIGARPLPKQLERFDGSKLTPVNNQEFIYGPDNRQVDYPSSYPWSCIGKVEVYPNAESENSNEWGSGVLIGDRIVLTAGHVVAGINPNDWKVKFTAGMYNGTPVSGSGAVSYVSDAKWLASGVSGHDYAVLRLYQPLGHWMGYFGFKTYSSSWNGGAYWYLCGYPYDIAGGNSPSYQNGIAVLDEDGDLLGGAELEHHGDTASGDSGGPFFSFWDGENYPSVVGTTSGHETIGGPSWTGGEDNNIEAGGSLLSTLLHQARSDWPL